MAESQPGVILVPEAVRSILNANRDWRERTSAGLCYQRYLDLWESGGKRLKDRASTIRGFARSFTRARNSKFAELLDALRQRQEFLFTSGEVNRGLRFDLKGDSPLVTGLGKEHPLESGMAFQKPYGVPYVAGSGVKGALRAACSRLHGDAVAGSIFGVSPEPKKGIDGHKGTVNIWDLLPLMPEKRGLFRADLNNPHFPDYYQKQSPPTEWQNPIPSYFLTLQTGLNWRLYVVLADHADEADHPDWREVVTACVRDVGEWAGLGGKKSWGYGLFQTAAVSAATEPSATPRTPVGSGYEATIGALKASRYSELRPLIATLLSQPAPEARRWRELLMRQTEGFEKKDRKKWRDLIEKDWPEGNAAG